MRHFGQLTRGFEKKHASEQIEMPTKAMRWHRGITHFGEMAVGVGMGDDDVLHAAIVAKISPHDKAAVLLSRHENI